MTRLIFSLTTALVLTLASLTPAEALEGYSAEQQQTFMDWCTGKESASESVCSCTLKRVAQTVPAATLSTYLASLSTGQSTSFGNLALTGTALTATTVAQAMASCGK